MGKIQNVTIRFPKEKALTLLCGNLVNRNSISNCDENGKIEITTSYAIICRICKLINIEVKTDENNWVFVKNNDLKLLEELCTCNDEAYGIRIETTFIDDIVDNTTIEESSIEETILDNDINQEQLNEEIVSLDQTEENISEENNDEEISNNEGDELNDEESSEEKEDYPEENKNNNNSDFHRYNNGHMKHKRK